MAVAKIEMWDARTLTRDQARVIGELLEEIWPKPNVTLEDRIQQQLDFGRAFDGPDALAPRSYVILDGERVIAHSFIFAREIRTTEGEMTIAALARVCSRPELRGQGLGEAVVRESLATVDSGLFPFSLFQTSPNVRPFYEKLGAAVIHNPFINSLAEGPKTNPFWHEVIMRYPSNRPWPTGTIDLRGLGY